MKSKLNMLLNWKQQLMKNKIDSKVKLEIDEMISNEEAKENRAKIVENFRHLSEDPERINLQQMWKKMKKLWPKEGLTVPTAKRNHKGKIRFGGGWGWRLIPGDDLQHSVGGLGC